MSSYRGKAVIVVSDLHVNSTTAVCLRRFNLDDGGSYYASPIQRELYKYWKNFVSDATKITEGFKRIIVFNGDIGELDTKKRSNQLITINKSTILRMVYDLIEPLRPAVDMIVYQLSRDEDLSDGILHKEHRIKLLNILNLPFKTKNKPTPLMIALHSYTASFCRAIKEKRAVLEVPQL